MYYNQTVKLEGITQFVINRGDQVADHFELINPKGFGSVRQNIQITKFEQTGKFDGVATVAYNDRKVRLVVK